MTKHVSNYQIKSSSRNNRIIY